MHFSEEQKFMILILLVIMISAAAIVIFIRQKKYCRRYDEREDISESCDTFISGAEDITAELYDTAELSQGEGFHIVLVNKKSGEKYSVILHSPAKNSMVIGRSRECDVTVSGESSVSARHCRLILAGSSILAEDLDSTNKTYLNGRQVLQPQLVKRGDVLTLGRSELEIAVLEEEK